jgi:hypothetical protein
MAISSSASVDGKTLHIRMGDYRTWHGGRYFIDPGIYDSAAHQIARTEKSRNPVYDLTKMLLTTPDSAAYAANKPLIAKAATPMDFGTRSRCPSKSRNIPMEGLGTASCRQATDIRNSTEKKGVRTLFWK